MNTSIQHPELKGIVQPSGDSSQSEATLSAWRKLPGRFTFTALLAGLLLLLFSAPAAHAQPSGTPPGCIGSGLGIFLDTPSGDSHVGCTICYSITVLNGGIGSRVYCDASNITAFVVTPDGTNHSIPLATLTTTSWEGGTAHPGRTYLSNGQYDYYTNVVCYTIRTNDIFPDGTVRATARDIAIILQNDTPSSSTNEQGVNTEVSLPGLRIAVSCVPSVGENGAITYTGTVTNTGNNTLFNVTVTNSITGLVTNFASIGVTNFASFSGFWVSLNPCIPSTNTFTATGNDSFTNCLPPGGITSSTNAVCVNTLTTGIKVTKTCFDPVPPGFLFTFGGSVSNTGNVTLTNIVVVNNQPSNNTPVIAIASLAPGAVTNFTGSYVAPTNCSVTDTLIARASSVCGFAVSSTNSATCTIRTTPQILVTALCPIAPVLPGGTLTYSVTVQNIGSFTLTNVVVFSDRPAPNTTVLIRGSLASGVSTNFNVTYTVPANACSVTTTFSGTGQDLCTLNAVTNTASPTICTVTTAPGIGVTLPCPVPPAVTGGLITYTGTVTNSGNVILTNVTVVDNQASPSTVLTVPSLASHAFAPFTASFYAPTNACSVSNTVTATGFDNCTQIMVTTNASVTCPLNTTPGIKVTKTCSVDLASPGQLLNFSGSVSNTGNITLTNIVVVNNQPSNNTPVFTLPSLAPGTTANFNGSYVAPTNCSVTDTLTARASSICGFAVTNTDTKTCQISTTPQILVTAACPTPPVLPGGTLTYSVTVQNTGSFTLTNVVVFSDRPAPNTTVLIRGSLASGVSTNFNVTYTVPANACSVTTTFSGTGQDLCTLNAVTNTASPTICTVTTAPGIGVTLPCPVPPAVTGGLITYTGTVTNSGNVILTNVTVVDNQASPSTVLTVPSLASHAFAPFTASFYAPTNACSVNNTVTATGFDNCTQIMVTTNASVTCPLNTTPGIQLTKTCSDRQVPPGQLLTFSGSVINTGNITLTNIVVVNNQPSNNTPVITVASLVPGAVTNFTRSYVAPTNCSVTDTLTAIGRSICGFAVTNTVSATCPIHTTPAIVVTTACPTNLVGQGGLFTFSGTVSNAGNITLTNIIVVNNWPSSNVVFTVGSLAPGATTNFTGSYLTPLNCCQAWIWVIASGQGCDGVTVTDIDSRTCTVFTSPSIVVTKVCDPRRRLLQPGGTLHYSGTVSNAGNITLVNVTVVDNQPANNTPVIWNVDPPGPIILAPGETAGYTGFYTVLPDFCGADTVTASGQDACSYALVTTNVTATCPIFTTPLIGVSKQCPRDPTPHGGLLTFSGTVTNMGNVTLTNVYVVNDQPSNNTPVIGPVILPPGDFLSFTGSYTAPLVCCEIIDTLTARGQDNCSGSNVTATATAICATLYNPGIALVPDQPCPPNLLPGSCYCFSGYVTNTGDAILTNVVVFSTGFPCQLNGVDGLPSLAPDGQIRSLIQTNLGPLYLAPGQWEYYRGCLTVPDNACEVTITVTSQDTCASTPITDTISCPITTTPCISITEDCPPGPVTIGDFVNFTGLVCNCGTIPLTNVYVFSSQLDTQIQVFAVIGSHDLVAAATSESLVLGPITLLPGECEPFSGGYYATGGNVTTIKTITTNTTVILDTNAPMWFGTIDPVALTYSNRFNVPSNLHGLMFEDGDPNWGPTLFYSIHHPGSGADTFDTISTIANIAYPGQQYVGFVTNEYSLTLTGYDALTFAAPAIYGSVNFYYLRHDSSGVAHFGEIIAQGASSDADLPNPLTLTGFTGLAFAAANVNGYGANMFYYVRNDTNGLSWFGSIDPTPGLVVTDLYSVGTNFDSLVYVDLAPITGWGTDYFAYLRHDSTGSILGTINPLTQTTTDYMHFGTNFLIALTFTTTDVGYGANLFYYIGGSSVTVTNYTTNSVVGGLTPTNTVTAIGWSICQPDGQPVTAAADCVGPIIPLVLDIGTTIDPNGGFMLSLSFLTQSGRSYYVEYTDVLIDPIWSILSGPTPGTGGIVTIPEPIDPGQPARFYRIMITTP
jgi:uncharacterized repeat protein (TIGR01451 family)